MNPSKPMTTPPDTPTPTPAPPASGVPGDTPTPPALGVPRDTPTPPSPSPPRLPSPRATAMLAAGMLALGVAVGAAIGPGVGGADSTLAGERLPLLLPMIASLARTGAGAHASASTPVQPPPVRSEATPTRKKRRRTRKQAAREDSTSATTTPISTSKTTAPATKAPPSTTKPSTLPPVTSVWLITLSGATFAQALAQPAAAPYIDSQLVPAGTLLSSWSSLEGSSFASEAGLLGSELPQTLDSIVQPPCPEGAAGASCAAQTPGALTMADEFLKATLPTITSSAAYRAHGLIVITFATIGNATASSLPPGASSASLSSDEPAGVLLISPFAKAGTRPASTFNPTSPKQSLSGLLH